MIESLINIAKFLGVFAILLVFIKPILYLLGMFAGLVGSFFAVFSWIGASCASVEIVSGLFSTFILGAVILKLYGLFHHNG